MRTHGLTELERLELVLFRVFDKASEEDSAKKMLIDFADCLREYNVKRAKEYDQE